MNESPPDQAIAWHEALVTLAPAYVVTEFEWEENGHPRHLVLERGGRRILLRLQSGESSDGFKYLQTDVKVGDTRLSKNALTRWFRRSDSFIDSSTAAGKTLCKDRWIDAIRALLDAWWSQQ